MMQKPFRICWNEGAKNQLNDRKTNETTLLWITGAHTLQENFLIMEGGGFLNILIQFEISFEPS